MRLLGLSSRSTQRLATLLAPLPPGGKVKDIAMDKGGKRDPDPLYRRVRALGGPRPALRALPSTPQARPGASGLYRAPAQGMRLLTAPGARLAPRHTPRPFKRHNSERNLQVRGARQRPSDCD